MAEPNHAQEHHLRMAANRAVKFSDGRFEDPSSMIREASSKLLLPEFRKDRAQLADDCERAAGLLLRAAEWLRRSKQ